MASASILTYVCNMSCKMRNDLGYVGAQTLPRFSYSDVIISIQQGCAKALLCSEIFSLGQSRLSKSANTGTPYRLVLGGGDI
jgi:hypothetical protein